MLEELLIFLIEIRFFSPHCEARFFNSTYCKLLETVLTWKWQNTEAVRFTESHHYNVNRCWQGGAGQDTTSSNKLLKTDTNAASAVC